MKIPAPIEHKQPFWSRVELIMRVLTLAGPVWFTAAMLYITLSRFSYPFELEWMEGGSLIQMLRLLEGKALYVRPTLEYIPYLYPPFYYYLSALLAQITGQAWFTSLRIISLASSIGTGLLIYFIIRRHHTNSHYWSLISVGLFAATFRAGGAWFDIARVDMLFIFLLIAATYCLETGTIPSLIGASILFTCAFFTKQTALPVFLIVLMYSLIFGKRKAALAVGSLSIACSVAWIWIENARSADWFWYYVFELPRLHTVPQSALYYFAQLILIIFPVSIAFTLSIIRLITAPKTTLQQTSGIWIAFAIGAGSISIIGALNPGSYTNTYIPAYIAIAILFGIETPRIINLLQSPKLRFFRTLIYLGCAVQFLNLYYNVPDQIPNDEDLKIARGVVVMLQEIDGDILIPNHNYLALAAGKKTYAHQIALQEIHGNFGSPEQEGWNALNDEINSALENKKFKAIILDQPSSIWPNVVNYYEENKIPYPSPDVFWPVTGGQTRPQFIYFPTP